MQTPPVGEVWTHKDHPALVITRLWTDTGLTVNEDGTPIRWAVFDNNNTLTYNYDRLTEFGWTRVAPEQL